MKKLVGFVVLSLFVFALAGCSTQGKNISSKEVTIIIKNDLTVLLGNKPVTLSELKNTLTKLQKKYDVSVQIIPEKDVAMESVQKMQQVIKEAGIIKLTFSGNSD